MGVLIWLLAAVAGFSHSKQSAMADYYRNVHLFFLKGKSSWIIPCNGELYLSLSWKKDLVRKTFLWFYTGYTHSQEQFSGFPVFFAALRGNMAKYIRKRLETVFREGSLPLMKYTKYSFIQYTRYVLFISLLESAWIYFCV